MPTKENYTATSYYWDLFDSSRLRLALIGALRSPPVLFDALAAPVLLKKLDHVADVHVLVATCSPVDARFDQGMSLLDAAGQPRCEALFDARHTREDLLSRLAHELPASAVLQRSAIEYYRSCLPHLRAKIVFVGRRRTGD